MQGDRPWLIMHTVWHMYVKYVPGAGFKNRNPICLAHAIFMLGNAISAAYLGTLCNNTWRVVKDYIP